MSEHNNATNLARVVDVTDQYAIAVIGPCLATIWRGQPTPESFQLRNDALIALCGELTGRCALVEIVEPSSKAPSDATRRVAMEVFKQLGGDLSCVGIVLEGAEMRATFGRAILTGMMFFVKQLQPTKVFKTPELMAEWVAPQLSGESAARLTSELLDGLSKLRALMPNQGA